jgi:putative ABC transport system ATP-binding protein
VQADVLVLERVSRWLTSGTRRVAAVRRVDFAMRRGELVVVAGRSGSGKSSLLALSGGLEAPDQGRVLIRGADVASLGRRAREQFLQRTVGWVIEGTGLLPLLTAEESVFLTLRIAGREPDEAASLAREALEATGLSHRAHHRTSELSGGEQQRLALARALVKAPALVLADDPLAQLDMRTAREILALIRDAADSGIAVLLASNDGAAAEIADRVLLMERGSLMPLVAVE